MMRRVFKKAIVVGGVMCAMASAGLADTDIAALKTRIGAVRKRLETLEKNQNLCYQSADRPEWCQNDVDQAIKTHLKAAKPGYIHLEGLNTDFKPVAFMKVNYIHSRKASSTAIAYECVFAPLVPVQGTFAHRRRGESHFTARQSMLGFETLTALPESILETKFDADFFGYTDVGTEQITNHYYHRLRHAYVKWTWGRVAFLFGQIDNTFRDLDVAPETADFEGPAGMASFRQPEAQMIIDLNAQQKLWVTLGNSESNYTETDGVTAAKRNTLNGMVTTTGFGLDEWPDLILKWRYEGNWGHVCVRGLSVQHRVRTHLYNARQHGWGAGVSGHLKVRDHDKLMLSYNDGVGIGRYNIEAFGQAAVFNTVTKDFSPIRSQGYMAAYQWHWTSELRSNIAWGRTRIYNPGVLRRLVNQEVNRDLRTWHVNMFWTPLKGLDLGLEFSQANRKIEDTRRGRGDRYEAVVKYTF
jgi:hypothetical protein